MSRTALLLFIALALPITALTSARPMTFVPSTNVEPTVIGFLSPTAQRDLAGAWAVYDRDLSASEYAYCLTDYRTVQYSEDTLLVVINQVVRAEVSDTTPSSAVFGCNGLPGLHSHPPTDCVRHRGAWACVPADTTDLCEPSENDLHGTTHDWHRFGLVQCGATRFLLFVPPPSTDTTSHG